MRLARLFRSLVGLVGSVAFMSAPIAAADIAKEPRFALVIGNNSYKGPVTEPLKNAISDSERVATALKEVGFEVDPLINATKLQIDNAIDKLGQKLKSNKGAVGFFYFSGHGTIIDSRSYLIPISRGAVSTRDDIKNLGIDVAEVAKRLSQYDGQVLTNIRGVFVVIDACRSELKLPSDSLVSLANRANNGRGDLLFGKTELPRVAILYGAALTDTAPDDGKFSTALARQISEPNQYHGKALTNTITDVMIAREVKDPNRAPYSNDLIRDSVCLKSCPSTPVAEGLNMLSTAPQYRTVLDGYDLLKGALTTGRRTLDEIKSTADTKRDAESLYFLALAQWE